MNLQLYLQRHLHFRGVPVHHLRQPCPHPSKLSVYLKCRVKHPALHPDSHRHFRACRRRRCDHPVPGYARSWWYPQVHSARSPPAAKVCLQNSAARIQPLRRPCSQPRGQPSYCLLCGMEGDCVMQEGGGWILKGKVLVIETVIEKWMHTR